MTTEAHAPETAATPGGLTDRLRNRWALAQTRLGVIEERAKAQWLGLPDQLRAKLDRLLARLVERLNLPTRADLSELGERIEELYRKLAVYEASRAGAGAPAAAPTATVAPTAAAAAPTVAGATPGEAETHSINLKSDASIANKTARRKHK